MKRRMLTIVMIISMLGICIRFWVSQDTHMLSDDPIQTQAVTPSICMTYEDNYDNYDDTLHISNKPVEVEDNFHSKMSCDWDSHDSYLLAKIAMAEAEGEDIEGKAYVIMVVLNRMLDDRFPDTIEDVIFAPKQFSPISNGRWDRVEPNDECWEALNMIMVDKWDKSQGALYFESCPDSDNWHSRNLEYLFSHGCHRFYR